MKLSCGLTVLLLNKRKRGWNLKSSCVWGSCQTRGSYRPHLIFVTFAVPTLTRRRSTTCRSAWTRWRGRFATWKRRAKSSSRRWRRRVSTSSRNGRRNPGSSLATSCRCLVLRELWWGCWFCFVFHHCSIRQCDYEHAVIYTWLRRAAEGRKGFITCDTCNDIQRPPLLFYKVYLITENANW